MKIQLYSISIFSLRKTCTYNFATTKLVLLPVVAPGSKSLLPPKKKEFLGLNTFLIVTVICACRCPFMRVASELKLMLAHSE